jgi:hypothetical protein
MVDQAPNITSANSTTFTVGTAGTFTVTTSGFPTASITESGALPSGVTLTDNGNGTATLSGTPAAGTGGVHLFTITASNTAAPNATQNFTLTIDQAPAITSANSTTFAAGTAGTFSVTTTGYPKSALSESGTPLPSGITFTDNGNGTATISATAAVSTSGVYSFTITANNGTTNASQVFTLTVNPVLAVLTSPTPGISTVLGATNVAFQWTAGVGVAEYQLNLGTTAPGASNLFTYKGTATSAIAPALPANGEKVYARLFSSVNGAWQYIDYLYTESGTPTPAVLTSPTPGVTTVLGTTSVAFQWTAGIAVTEYQLNLSAVAPGQSDLFTYKGTATSAIAPNIPKGGMTVYATLYSLINGAWQSNNYLYTESGSLPAKLTSPTPGLGTILGTSSVTFQWTTGAEVSEYQLNLSAIAQGDSDLFLYKGTATSAIAATLPANGVKVYATLYSLINGAWQSNSYVYTESGIPTPATLTSPTPGLSTILGTSSVIFQWTTGVAVTEYQLNLSAIAPGDSDLYSYKGTATTATAATLPANAVEVYARLYSNINGAWQYKDYVYTESGTPAPAMLTSPTPGLSTILGTTNVVFKWNAGVGVTEYQLNLSAIAAGDSDLYSYKGTATTATASALPANAVEVYARLYSLINGAWQYNDYVYTESGTPTPATLTSPTPGLGTVLGTSDVLFQWSAGVGVADYQLNLSAVAAGGSDLFSYKGTALTATASTLPSNGVKVYARLYSRINGVWQYNDYVYTEQ